MAGWTNLLYPANLWFSYFAELVKFAEPGKLIINSVVEV